MLVAMELLKFVWIYFFMEFVNGKYFLFIFNNFVPSNSHSFIFPYETENFFTAKTNGSNVANRLTELWTINMYMYSFF